MSRRLPAQITYDEICSAAFDGLIEAVEAYDPKHKAKFETFCQQRISGAVMDWLRSLDPQSRTVRTFEKQKMLAKEALGFAIALVVVEEPGLVEALLHAGTNARRRGCARCRELAFELKGELGVGRRRSVDARLDRARAVTARPVVGERCGDLGCGRGVLLFEQVGALEVRPS